MRIEVPNMTAITQAPIAQFETNGMYFDFESAETCDDKMDKEIFGKFVSHWG